MKLLVEGLCKSYDGISVLEKVTFSAEEGVTCIMAPSGAGKTTLLRILLGLEHSDSGTVTGLADAQVSAVFQEDRLLEQLDARGNLRFVLGKQYDEQAASGLLEELGLADVGGKSVREYSGGMKRRLALTRALLVPFDLLVLDEPFTGLDEENRRRAAACVQSRSAGKTVLLVTHEKEDAAGLNARIITLQS